MESRQLGWQNSAQIKPYLPVLIISYLCWFVNKVGQSGYSKILLIFVRGLNISLLKDAEGAIGMVQWLGELTTLAQDPSLVPSNHIR